MEGGMLGSLVRRLAAASFVAVSLAAAGASMPLRAETPPDTLVQAWLIDDLISLDPAEMFEFSGLEYATQVYDRLVTYDVDNVSEILPKLAESWEVSEDGLTFTFVIRDGVVFHSGNPLTAADVEYSLRRAVDLGLGPAFILTQFSFTSENM